MESGYYSANTTQSDGRFESSVDTTFALCMYIRIRVIGGQRRHCRQGYIMRFAHRTFRHITCTDQPRIRRNLVRRRTSRHTLDTGTWSRP